MMPLIRLLLFTSLVLLEAQADDFTLVWSDHFDQEEIDFTKWSIEENAHGGGNQELQAYLDRLKNVRVEDGCLVIEAHKEAYNLMGTSKPYTSGRIRSKRRAAWTYGRFEIKAKLPEGRGIWPAIWLLPEENVYGNWAASGEIDIVELLGHEPHKIHGSIHYGGTWPHNEHRSKSFQLEEGSFSDRFHIFAIEWEPKEIRWYVDGVCYHTAREWHSEGAPFPAPFDQPFHLLLNLAIGGNWPGAPSKHTSFPARLYVDYVKVYQTNSPKAAVSSKTNLPVRK